MKYEPNFFSCWECYDSRDHNFPKMTLARAKMALTFLSCEWCSGFQHMTCTRRSEKWSMISKGCDVSKKCYSNSWEQQCNWTTSKAITYHMHFIDRYWINTMATSTCTLKIFATMFIVHDCILPIRSSNHGQSKFPN